MGHDVLLKNTHGTYQIGELKGARQVLLRIKFFEINDNLSQRVIASKPLVVDTVEHDVPVCKQQAHFRTTTC